MEQTIIEKLDNCKTIEDLKDINNDIFKIRKQYKLNVLYVDINIFINAQNISINSFCDKIKQYLNYTFNLKNNKNTFIQ